MSALTSNEPASAPGVPLRVLQLEDNPDDAELALRQLRRGKMQVAARRVETEPDFAEALDTFAPDIVLVDFSLPSFDGRAALQHVRRVHPEIPVIIVSGVLGDEAAVELVRAGARDFVLKDRLARLPSAVTQALEQARDRRRRGEAERRVREQETWFRTIFENAPLPKVIASCTGHIQQVNAAFTALLGYAADEIRGRSIEDITHPEDRALTHAKIDQVGGRATDHQQYEKHYLGKDGRVVCAMTTVTGVELNGQRYLVGQIVDLTGIKQAATENAAVSERLRTAMEGAGAGSWEADIADGTMVWDALTRAQYRLRDGEPTPDIVNWLRRVHADDARRLIEPLERVMSGAETAFDGEFRVSMPDGSVRWFRSFGRVVSAAGQPVRMTGINLDITEVKTAQAEREREREVLHESERRLAALINNVPGFVYRCRNDPAWTMESISAGCAQLTGYPPDEFIGPRLRPYADIVVPEDRESVWEAVQAGVREKRPYEIRYRIRTATGDLRWFWERGAAICDKAGSVEALEGLVCDVTAEVEAQARQRELAAIVRGSSDAVITASVDGRIRSWNAAAEALFGYDPAETTGRPLADFVAGPLQAEIPAQVARLMHGEAIEKAEYTLLRPDGLLVEAELSASTISDERGVVSGLAVIVRDIGARKRFEREREARLMRSQAQLGALAGLASHPAMADGDVEALARWVTEAASRATGVARANVWLFNEAESELRCIDLYVDGTHSSGAVLEEAAYANEFRALKAAPYVDASHPLTDPRTAGYVDSYVRPLGITSMLDVVVEIGGRHLGLLGLEHVGVPHEWQTDEISFGCQLAQRLGQTLLNQSRLQAQRELQRRESDLREAQRVARIGNWEVRPHTGDVRWSAEIFRIFGLDPTSAAPRYQERLLLEESEARWRGAVSAAVVSGTAFALDLCFMHPQLGMRWISVCGEAVRDQSGHVSTVRGTLQDITERKVAESMAREARELTESILNAIPVRVFWKDRDSSFLGCNEAFARDAGFSAPADLVGKDDRQMAWHEQAERYRADDRSVIQSGQAKLFIEEPQTNASGSTATLLTSKVPLRDADGKVRGVLGAYMDITERKQQQRDLARVNRTLKALSQGNRALVHARSEQELYDAMTRAIVEGGGYRMAWVGLLEDGPEQPVRAVGSAGDTAGYVAQVRVSWGDNDRGAGPTGCCARSGQLQVSGDILANVRMAPWHEIARAAGYRSSIALPLMSDRGVFGVLNIYAGDVDAFQADEIALLTEMAGDLAFGVVNLRLRADHELAAARLERSMEATVQVLASTVEMRDPYTSGHQGRVAELAVRIGRQLGLSEDTLRGLHLAASIHDIGKLCVPGEILSKPGRLSPAEYELIKQHPDAGARILEGIEFPWPIREIVWQHHERLDGMGYPRGLKGDQILLEARVLTVADVLEAVSAHRPYRPALGIPAALELLRQGRGTAFDERVVDACLALFGDATTPGVGHSP